MKKVLGLLLVCFLLVGCGVVDSAKEKIKEKIEETTEETTKGNTEEVTSDEKVATEKVLTCSNYTENTVNFTTEMSYYFKGDELEKLGIKYTYDLSSYTDTQREAFAAAKMCDTDAIKTTLGMEDCTEGLSGTNYIVKGTSEKMRSQSMGTLDIVKYSYESENWTCSVN